MNADSYSIVDGEINRFAVLITHAGGGKTIVDAFTTIEEAEAWIIKDRSGTSRDGATC